MWEGKEYIQSCLHVSIFVFENVGLKCLLFSLGVNRLFAFNIVLKKWSFVQAVLG